MSDSVVCCSGDYPKGGYCGSDKRCFITMSEESDKTANSGSEASVPEQSDARIPVQTAVFIIMAVAFVVGTGLMLVALLT
jgi:hypothetical protein